MAKLINKTLKRAQCTVYDLCVEPSHTYNVEGLAVHNSGAGSLVNYVLGITHVDPLRYNLLFARFLSSNRIEAPDIDCLLSDHLVLMADGTHKRLDSLIIGDKIITMNGTHRCVTTVVSRMSRDNEVIERLFIETHGVYGTIICTADHRLMLFDGTYIKCRDIDVGTVLHGVPTPSRVISKQRINNQLSLTDIEVEGEHTFQIVPFDVAIMSKDLNRYACLIDTYINVHKNKLEQMVGTSTIIKLE